ncbi:MAG TPA: hypothetical protein VFY85_15055 [Gemmatimonadaceae bacterium]|nr:hypothetical protein [Gemmatimonadaceae bacterium]
MRLRLANEIKGTAGAVIGFVAGIVVSIPALLIVAMMAGKDREVLALGLMFYVVPLGAVVGVIAGVIAGSRGRLKRLVNGSAGVFAVVYVASLVISAWQDEQAEQRVAATSEPDGCRNEYRDLTFTSLGGFVVSFERLCGQASHGTMNCR